MSGKSKRPDAPLPSVMTQPPAAPTLDLLSPGNQALLGELAPQAPDPFALSMPAPLNSPLTNALGGIPLAGGMLSEWSRDPQAYVEQNWKPVDPLVQQSEDEYQKITGKELGTTTGSYTFEF
jgi:hypothetical protein